MYAHLTIRKITNGYLVSQAGLRNSSILGGGENEAFYPSREAILGDAESILSTAMEGGDREASQFNQMSAAKQQLSPANGASIGY